ncbi:redox protein [Sphingomonas sp. Leaf33]|uniref:sulfurtransferase TusA family protein n=1 Tax=Sphingomonas sp. Leaf33 TaxID=1736215 RepID=UPI0006F42255|nr:sulfurtransferase TusA family protein [Sphingomonas sp. Leaf33]KQN25767.1 redox protein [Sphingomonas sp. Leaf33]
MRIDARGMRCPWPALRLAKTLRTADGPVEVMADDPIAPRELAAVATAAGWSIEPIAADHFRVVRLR